MSFIKDLESHNRHFNDTERQKFETQPFPFSIDSYTVKLAQTLQKKHYYF